MWASNQPKVQKVNLPRVQFFVPDTVGAPLQPHQQPGVLSPMYGTAVPCVQNGVMPFPDAGILDDLSYYVDDSMAFGGYSGHNFLERNVQRKQ